MLISILAFAMMQQPCPLTIGIGKDGGIFFDRLHGWYKTSPKMLESVLHAGCFTDGDPHPITSVKIVLASDAPKKRLDLVNSILKQEGLTPDRVTVQPWVQYPRKPR
jgi:hypothetical protein